MFTKGGVGLAQLVSRAERLALESVAINCPGKVPAAGSATAILGLAV